MFRPRIIPVLLLKGKALVKSVRFKNYKYIGEPMNAVRLFNDMQADELVFLDIEATKENRTIPLEVVRKIGEETNMPFAVGGGIKTIRQIREILNAGAEKVIINSVAAINPEFIKRASETFGSSTIVVCMDVKKDWLGRSKTWVYNGKKNTGYDPIVFAKMAVDNGCGEIIVQAIKNDGMMTGYDISLIRQISLEIPIPVVALGGAGSLLHMAEAFQEGCASGLAAGSLFIYQGKHKGVLINYPEPQERYIIVKEERL